MRKPILIIIAGILVGLGAYASLYFTRTAALRSSDGMNHPELGWLKHEFELGDGDFQTIQRLHEQYLPECAKMCEQIDTLNAELEALVLSTNQVTADISRKLSEISDVRRECQTRMLNHFYAVSQAMPEEQGRRYLGRMQRLTSLSGMRHEGGREERANGH